MDQEGSFEIRRINRELIFLTMIENDLSMVVVLPFEDNGLAALEGKLTAEVLLKAVGETRKMKVEVTLPKFKVRFG